MGGVKYFFRSLCTNGARSFTFLFITRLRQYHSKGAQSNLWHGESIQCLQRVKRLRTLGDCFSQRQENQRIPSRQRSLSVSFTTFFRKESRPTLPRYVIKTSETIKRASQSFLARGDYKGISSVYPRKI